MLTWLAVTPARAQIVPSWVGTRELIIDGAKNHLEPAGFLRVDRGGTIYLAQQQSLNVRVFAADGSPVRTLGPKANGSGKFKFLEAGGFVGDAFWTREPLTVYFPDGRLSAAPTIGGPTGRGAMDAHSVVAILPDGDLLSTVAKVVGDSLRTALAHFDAKGVLRYIIDERVPFRFDLNYLHGDDRAWSIGTDLNEPMVGMSVDGAWFASVSAPVTGDGVGQARVIVRRPSGDTVYARSFAIVLYPIRKAEVDSFVDRLIRDTKARADRARLAASPRPEYYPPVQRVCVGRDGSVLIAAHSDGLDRQLLLIGPTGAPVAIARLPANVDVRQIEGNLIWGIERTHDGVESVVRYRVHS